MFPFFTKQKNLHDNILKYLAEVLNSTDLFATLMGSYVDNGFTDEFHDQAKLVHKSESKADDIRYLIEKDMYQHSLLPDSRSDIFVIIEELDRIPGIYEKTIEYLLIRKLIIPQEIKVNILLLLETALATSREIIKGTEQMFTKPKVVPEHVRTVDTLESKCDRLEHHLLKKIFDMDIDDLSKERLSRIVELIADISDQAENVGNRLSIAAVKRIM
ncbi:MAG: hypothetical protein DKM50_00250 [Candidatus Margulisiibacteriota bacterium]|nr:MAG: hypothetical protein A2X43_06135 [Candidatus Margulisbacteria bacterium GWD2_39_127]OGI01402.1 MAG: hypothetical protein A2X42_12960 [Candidatus Margulisbacteria bacterium GWF2_38_17]OGI10320.1 MAG: hypothetical protein A2X41_12945 [Candidatus Margulisbacteria bacterium GWE2_39_32]PZM84965.1 MAG: hypothetical protein DKM50_00250 [Candidatus Margulisiibacteriota bacterium]HAR62015.1 hypothetical protein [Candidatus Margulisiibacteriota bacterium]